MKKYDIQDAVHEELLYQLEGLLNIELGGYLFDFETANESHGCLELDIDRGGNGLDVYVHPSDEQLSFDNEDDYMIGHYHPDDLLFLILNWEKEKQKMKQEIDRIIYDYIKGNGD